ncbi:glutamine synthetase family protein [Ancylobacter sp. 6x-1]|uniref:Glutamine synthetase family protein n=1 Tax=Ancylobacter crimeensis TaxID=2579147 RepID=A0ABT0DE53_9HYPH|nr:glutamine synthetase family protein [Ancylobacter crimeensis]MCK0198236.1 glutamine synthetase family protein [Ancylobacter crimeensis]
MSHAPIELTSIVTTDFAAITRGRPVPHKRLGSYAAAGVGWVPANVALTPFNIIADPNPFGSAGDLRIRPDLDAVYRTAATGAPTPLGLAMGTLVELDGAPWCCCSRTILADALAALEAATGLRLLATFEQEFQIVGAGLPPAHAFSPAALRRADPLGGQILAALTEAGVEPEMVLAEYGADQYEVTHAPTHALAAADRAVAIREIVREIIANRGWHASFAPKTSPTGVGNGVHIHVSLVDDTGAPVGYDPSAPGGLSAINASFLAGILRHMRAITVLTAASLPSYYRLQPHGWSAAWTWLGDRDREASLRICPLVRLAGKDPARQFNVEYRAADATANPYLALAALVRAGLEGLKAKLPPPPIFSGDPALLEESERARLGLARLPGSLEEALAVFEADETVRSWFHPLFVETYAAVRRQELAILAGKSPEDVCALYRDLY